MREEKEERKKKKERRRKKEERKQKEAEEEQNRHFRVRFSQLLEDVMELWGYILHKNS